MKNIGIMLSVLFCATLLPAITVNSAEVAGPNPGQTAVEQPIPVQILGKTIEIRKGMTRSDAKAAMSLLIADEASIDTAERLQYDVPLVPDNAPVAICFDFDKKGIVSNVVFDSMLKEQNPAVTTLVAWLRANAGKPRVKKKGSATWVFGGWKIEHAEGGSGEDSTYRIELTRSK
ncbi:MAG: hypothetical protein LLG06_19240 [Desulfobacteraceae bacterium]|nr:hypothetical protein [Desulfobacteraceae bacterium]